MSHSPKQKTFFVSIHTKEGEPIAHAASTDPSRLLSPPLDKRAPPPTVDAPKDNDFRSVLQNFITTMDSYRRFIPMTFGMAPFMLQALAGRRVRKFAEAKGKERVDLSREDVRIFELALDCLREFRIIDDEIDSAIAGVKLLPEIALIGLVSAYDAYLADLLKIVLERHNEIFFTSEKSILFSELVKFESIDEAKEALIEREVDAVMRSSHHEQFSWMEKHLALPLRDGLKVWPKFVELCERRNLMTHTGGVVSKQYVANCASQKAVIAGVKVGDKLTVNPEYYESAVNATYEIGVKLCYVLWRKFAKSESARADTMLNELSFDLIHGRAYAIAEALLRFAVDDVKGKREQKTLGMMTINLANAIRLQDRKAEAKSLLLARDWSGSSRILRLGVAAVSEDIDEVVKLMKEIGNSGDVKAEHYRTWPIFRGMRSSSKLISAFESVFGETLISPNPAEKTTRPADITTNAIQDIPNTKH